MIVEGKDTRRDVFEIWHGAGGDACWWSDHYAETSTNFETLCIREICVPSVLSLNAVFH